MKPIQLSISAFGPYKGKEVIDFQELKKQHLFLITGPTGAGKTSIFDAICYALYGETSGTDRPEKSIRCQNAAPEVLTEVTFTFELKGAQYTVHRRPKQERLKKSGRGYTEAPGEATLTLPKESTPITGLTGVTEKVTDLVGLELSQFRQIMMIPQGEFRKLLVAKSDERTEILKRIFKTHLYGELQRKFKEKSRDLEKRLEQKLIQRKNELLKLSYDPHTPEGKGLQIELEKEHLNIEKLFTFVRSSLQEDRKTLEELKREKEQRETALGKLYEQRQKAVDNNQKLKELEDLKAALKELEGQQESFSNMERDLRSIKKAQRIAPKRRTYMERKKEGEEKQKEIQKGKRKLEELNRDLQELEKKKEEVTSETYRKNMEFLTNALTKFDEYRRVLREVESIDREYDQRDKSLKKALENHRNLKESLAKCKKELEAYQRTLEALKGTEKNLYEKERQLTVLKQRNHLLEKTTESMKSLEEANKEVDKKKEVYERREENWKQADAHWKEMRKVYHLNQAANLAKELERGMPCPVCGSKEHPMPAFFSQKVYSLEEVEKGEKAVEKAANEKNKAQIALETAKATKINEEKTVEGYYKELLEILPEDRGITKDLTRISRLKKEQQEAEKVLEDEIKTLEENRKVYNSTEEKKSEVEKSLDRLVKEEEVAREEVQAEERAMGLLEAEKETLLKNIPTDLRQTEALEKKETSVSSELKEKEEKKEKTLEAYQEKLGERTRVIATLETEERMLKENEERCNQQKKLYTQALEEENITEEKLLQMERRIPEAEALEQALKDYNEALNNKKSAIEQQRSGIESFEKNKIEIFDGKIHELKEKLGELQEEMDTVNQRKISNDTIMNNVEKLNQDMGKEEKEYETLGHIANVVSGNNERRLPFQRFILRSYLADVLVAANHRFAPMTGGRYTLKLADGIEDRRASGGLDLEVFDRYSGLPRSVKTLSGGESFKASLSMALGLAEVVQSYAGGIMLDTVFIDEGFGTLDQESLDSAINCLIDLQDSGRLVGIISHVEELKERIQAQLIVHGDEFGSRTEFRVN